MKRIASIVTAILVMTTALVAGQIVDIERTEQGPGRTLPVVNERALVIKLSEAGEKCSLFDGDGNLVYGDGGIKIITSSANGNMMIRCEAADLANSTGLAVRYDADDNPIGPGTKCGILTPSGLCLTDTWVNVISNSGQGHIVCHFRNASCD